MLILATVGIVGLSTAIGLATAYSSSQPQERFFTVSARQYAYSPAAIKVNKGDRVHIRLLSQDVIHGFFLEAYDLDAKIDPARTEFELLHPSRPGEEPVRTREIVFTADRVGKFRYRCSHTCGYLHPFMLGEFIVEPNYPYRAGWGATVGLFLAVFMVLWLRSRKSSSPDEQSKPAAGREAETGEEP
jgi:heme/copper-type cytochrome/quinol oxidase subunit 2